MSRCQVHESVTYYTGNYNLVYFYCLFNLICICFVIPSVVILIFISFFCSFYDYSLLLYLYCFLSFYVDLFYYSV